MKHVIDTRCIHCRGEFASASYESPLQCCPSCGSQSVPADPRLDQDWTLTRWEWRVLLTLAFAYAAAYREQDPQMSVPITHLWALAMGAPMDDGELAKAAEAYVRADESTALSTVKLSPHELRILTIWAAWCVEGQVERSAVLSDADLEPILAKLRPQAKVPIALTFADEITDLREHFPSVEVHFGKVEPE